ncbi:MULTISPECIES: hypothetical protein [Shewanella]|jgi:hypothetical protein|uniref:hypothetical protein n=1 Tax=Shewanella TaxID=22 RepID=UPI0021DB13DC|nr:MULTISPECIES: hypothetical protein [unclassified Shewanella]MCU7965370.1 hypothetical protein [Shewanella sp. SW32]MCU7973355.1 hypothetical protein [Shewanella sp. SW29]MCU7988775.1 hypothetical protein [Shewanella sp. SW24]MCU8001095.1 hypothetical protein [Shewanella sp. SM95]MCU8015038.1 hypothetical protein [Shewanella sp. SM74]
MIQLPSLTLHDVVRNLSGLGFFWALWMIFPYRHNHAIPLLRSGAAIALMAAGLYRLSDTGLVEFNTPAFLALATLLVTTKMDNTNTFPAMVIQNVFLGSTLISLFIYGIGTVVITCTSAAIFLYILNKAMPEDIHN